VFRVIFFSVLMCCVCIVLGTEAFEMKVRTSRSNKEQQACEAMNALLTGYKEETVIWNEHGGRVKI